MKLNYDLLKNILLAMEAEDSHLCGNMDLAVKVNIGVSGEGASAKITDDKLFENFIGHIRILNDNNCIECESPSLGFRQDSSGGWIVAITKYRLTSNGYEFLDILRNDTVFNKVKNLSISTTLDVGKTLLTQVLTGAMAG